MRVTFLVPGNFPPTTGAIVYDNRLAGALRDLGHETTIIPIAGQHPLPDDAARASAAAVLAEHSGGNALIIIDGFCLYAFDGLDGRLGHAIGLVHHPISGEPNLPDAERAVFAAAEARLIPSLRRVLVPSADVAARIATLHARVDVLAPGMPDVGRSVGSGGPSCHLIAVGSLIPRKGHDVVLRALAGLPDLDWRLTLIGDGGIDPVHATTLHALADSLGIAARVTFAGSCGGDEMETFWRSADIFVSGSDYEGYGMAVAEAVRRGIPLAVTTGAAATDVIPATCSAVVPPRDYVQLTKALRRLVFSTPLRRALSDAAWDAGRALPTWQDQANRFVDLATSD
jgi:glycosyltransferase involved in cell wall biosynthesis